MTTNVELVEAWTADGLRLHGALNDGASAIVEASNVDALVLLSGVGSNFYGSSLMAALADAACRAGVAALRVNTRGHDMISTAQTREGGRLIGAAYEIVDDCRFDVAAWIECLSNAVISESLLGHSLGGSRYSTARQSSRIRRSRVIAIRHRGFRTMRFCSARNRTSSDRRFVGRQNWLKPGSQTSCLERRFRFRSSCRQRRTSTSTAPSRAYDLTKFAADVAVSTCFTFGEIELHSGGIAFAGIDERVRNSTGNLRRLCTIAGANHFYAGRCRAVFGGL